jgi:hypothetical protein
MVEMLDAKYDKADLPSIKKNSCAHLSTSHCNSLLGLLFKFDELFDGMLRDWKLLPVSFELKDWVCTEIITDNLISKSAFQAVPWQAIPYCNDTQGYPYEGNQPPDIDRSIEVATIV